MRLIVLLSFIFLLAPISVTAQNPEKYRLRNIPPETFIETIPDLMAHDIDRNISGFADDITTEMQLRYGDISQRSEAEINRAYQSLKSTDSFVRINRAYWNQQLIMSHINGAGLKLSDGDTYYWFGTHVIRIEERDFNADGQPEFLLHVNSEEYRQMLVLEAVANNHYRLVPAPLPWFADGQPYFSTLSGGLEEVLFDDILNDGSPEWVLTLGGMKANHKQHGRLIILKWRDDQLIDIASMGDSFLSEDEMSYEGVSLTGPVVHPPYVNWFTINVDDDSAQEIRQVQEFTDNWTCTFIETRTFDWNADAFSYQFLNIDRVYEESAGCNLRRAQQVMWDGDIEGAVELYKASRNEAHSLSDIRAQYLDLRLALAYSLIGKHAEADALLHNLQTQLPSSEFMGTLIERVTSAYTRLPTALNLCQAMYNQFAEGFNFFKWEAQNLGVIKEVPVLTNSIDAPLVNPVQAGCDFPEYLEDYMHSLTVPLNDQFNVEPIRRIAADFDNDGAEEHLIWFSQNKEFFPYFLTINGVSRPPIPFPDENTVLITQTLDTGETILIYKFFQDDVNTDELSVHNDQFYLYRCYPLQDRGNSLERERGYLRLWRLNGSELVTTLDIPLCEDISTNRVLNRDDISGWAIVDETSAVEANYEWNDETDRYEIVSLNTEAIPENSVNNNQNTPSISYAIYRSKREYQDTGNWFWGILRMERALDSNADDIQGRIRLHYWLGFFYEMAGIESRAVEHYLTAATEGSGTAWGELAALHLTPKP
ncbi:MAG: hypothetical protein L0154_01780 [Chloroflexi bacterium]|nr:hypothetical protein [Chloroflexota bacterium]